MKIFNRKQFLELPSGVFYSNFKYCIMDGLYIKYDSIGDVDWVCQCLIDTPLSITPDYSDMNDIYEKSHKDNKSFELDYDRATRDGLYEENQLFAVYEKEDVIKLIQFLQKNTDKYPTV